MEIDIDQALVLRVGVYTFLCETLVQLGNHLFGRENRRLQGWVRIFIVSVEVLVASIISEVTSINTVWIQTRNDLEYEIISESFRRLIVSK